MRTLPAAICFSIALAAGAQHTPLINELQASNHGTISAPDGTTPDWVEIHNPGTRTIDLLGMRLVIAGRQHVIDAPLKVLPNGNRTLWMDGHPEKGADHIGFKLPRTGGTLLLIDADGATILDVFTWKDLRPGQSMGRVTDGAKSWGYFAEPTPGLPNDLSTGSTQRPPQIAASHGPSDEWPLELTLSAENALIFYTTDGSAPEPKHGQLYTRPLTITEATVIRARAFTAEGLGGREFHHTFLAPSTECISLTIAEKDLWDQVTGIHSDGEKANHTRSGREWERPAFIQHNGRSVPVGLRINGSGSRALEKRSFKVYMRNRYDSPQDGFTFSDGGTYREGILRADASPDAFLRNVLMEVIASHPALHLAVQRSLPMPLYINGGYHGLYRWMPPKDAQWLKHVAGAEAVDVLDGPAYTPISGRDQHFRRGLELLLNGAPADSLDRYFDLRSLVDLACLDLFTGRADHDLNVRCYRPREKDGRWKWVLYDMDIWAPVADHTVGRMATSFTVETPYVPQLLAEPGLRGMLLARMAALHATLLSSAYTQAAADSIHHAHIRELERDHQHWQGRLQRPDPVASHKGMIEFLEARGGIILGQLAERCGHPLHTLLVEVPEPAIARITIDGMPMPTGRQRIQLFDGIDMRLEVHPAEGVEFLGWNGAEGQGTAITVIPGAMRVLKPRLATATSGRNGL